MQPYYTVQFGSVKLSYLIPLSSPIFPIIPNIPVIRIANDLADNI